MTMPQALSRLRVLDLSRILAAPYAAQMLGDMGAEVIKIERPGRGDDARIYGPSYVMDEQGRKTQNSSFFLSANRNKKSVTVDLSKPEGQALIRELALQCDVLIENYKVGDLKRYGLDYDSLSKVNPRLVYCSVTGFGQFGPYAPKPGYDTLFQAMGGLMSTTGLPDDEPGGGPMKAGPSLADIMAGQVAAFAIMSALHHRDVSGGQGQHIDVSLLDSLIAANSHLASEYLLSGRTPQRRGTEGNGGMPSRVFSCADGDVVLIAGNQEQWARLCKILGCEEIMADPRFADTTLRGTHRKALVAIMAPLVLRWRRQDLIDTCDELGVPCGPVNDLRQVFDDPHVRLRGMSVEADHPEAASGKVTLIAHPARYSGTPVTQYTAPPTLGQHTREVLSGWLGLDDARLAELHERGVI